MDENLQHLKLLSVFHYVLAGVIAFFACIPIIHIVIGLVMLFAPPEETPRFVGLIFALAGFVFFLGGWALAVAVFYAGRCLARRRRHLYCLVVGGVQCIFMPVGTVLGIFTILVLMKPEVKDLFADNAVR